MWQASQVIFFYEHQHFHRYTQNRAETYLNRARCHDLLYIQCGCVMQFGAKRCAQRARRGCTGHDGRALSAWAVRTGPIGAPHNVRKSRVPTSLKYVKPPNEGITCFTLGMFSMMGVLQSQHMLYTWGA
jgi:hypothetical protein